MGEKKEIKISLTTLFLIIAIILIVIMGIYIFNLYKANQKSESSINELNTKINALENSIKEPKNEENIANTTNQISNNDVINNNLEMSNVVENSTLNNEIINYEIEGTYYEKNAQGDEPSYTFSKNDKVTYGSLWICNGTYTIDKDVINIKFTSAEDPDGNKAKVKDFGVEESVKLTIVNENELKDSNGLTYVKK